MVKALVRGVADDKVHKIDNVRTVGLCPWTTDTGLVRSLLLTEDDINAYEKATSRKILQPAEIGKAFEQLVKDGKSGDMLTVTPEAKFFYPNLATEMLYCFTKLALVAKKVRGEDRLVKSQDILVLAGGLLVLAVLVLSLLLRLILPF